MNNSKVIENRPPIVAIMGHVDHGKSTLLDTILETKHTENESGGITQHVSAYSVVYTMPDGIDKGITFIDTPGHAAFQSVRTRSANIADIAILIIAADDGVKMQTREAWKTITDNNVPYIVAINKIDKPNADIDKTIRDLIEMGCYLEGYGGDISYVQISAKIGTGIDELLETVLLLSEFIDLSYNAKLPASGFVIESHMDPQCGIAATIVLKNGTLHTSEYVVAGRGCAPARSIESFDGKIITHANASDPVTIYGFSEICPAGTEFTSYVNRDQAEKCAKDCTDTLRIIDDIPISDETTIIPTIVKCDTLGSVDAVINQIRSCSTGRVFFKIVHAGIGNINESDIQIVAKNDEPLIIGFNIDIDKRAAEMDEINNIHIKTFNIIYRITEWIEEVAENRKFRKKIESQLGGGQILKVFSSEKGIYLIGIRVASGLFSVNDSVRIVRGRDIVMRGKIKSIQAGKMNLQKIDHGNDAGMMIQLPEMPRQFDIIETFEMVEG